MDQKKSNSGQLTLEVLEHAKKLLETPKGMFPDKLYMSKSQYDSLKSFFNQDMVELEVGDWVFIDNVHVGEVTEVDIEDITTEYIVNIIESAAAKKPIVLRLTSQNTLMKVPKGSKLQSLLVLHGR